MKVSISLKIEVYKLILTLGRNLIFLLLRSDYVQGRRIHFSSNKLARCLRLESRGCHNAMKRANTCTKTGFISFFVLFVIGSWKSGQAI